MSFQLRIATFAASLLLLASCDSRSSGRRSTIRVSPIIPALEAVESPTNADRVTLRGSVTRPGSDLRIEGGAATLQVTVPARTFAIEVELNLNAVNHLFVTELRVDGTTSPAVPINVVQDGEIPDVHIDFPPAGAVLTTDTIDVSGRVSDRHSGFNGLRVDINGIEAVVDVGIGTNGTFIATGVPLGPGGTVELVAVASDILGNASSTSISVERDIASGPRMSTIDGDRQVARIQEILADPLVVKVVRDDGTAFPGKTVTFSTIRSDGRLSGDGSATGPWSASFQAITDGGGIARAWMRLGSDAGCGNNRVEVRSADIAGSTYFSASAQPGAAAQINVGGGNYQRGQPDGPLPTPLVAWVSDACNPVAGVKVVFEIEEGAGYLTAAPQPPARRLVVATDAAGHAAVGLVLGPDGGSHVVRADFNGNATGPARYFADSVAPSSSGTTMMTGVVLDNAHRPIGGALCTLYKNDGGSSVVESDAAGIFTFGSVPFFGPAHLRVDGLVATTLDGAPIAVGSFPTLMYEVVLVADARNALGMPVLLPPLDPANVRSYSMTVDTVLTCAGIEGLTMTVRAGSMTIGGAPAPDGALMSLNQVHHDDVPMPMPDGAAPPFAWTLQPGGAHFDPPVTISYPNMTGLPAGAIANFLSFDHDTSRFEIVASGHVTADGSTILSDPGVGIRVAGWGCNCPPYSVAGDCEGCPEDGGDAGGLAAGEECDPCQEAANKLKDYFNQQSGSQKILAGQIACLAAVICESKTDGGWGDDDFFTEMLSKLAENYTSGFAVPLLNDVGQAACIAFQTKYPALAIEIPLPDALGGGVMSFEDACTTVLNGGAHQLFELTPAFVIAACNGTAPSDADYDDFLNKAVVPCFDDRDFVPDLPQPLREFFKWYVPNSMGLIRDGAAALCDTLHGIQDFLSIASSDHARGLVFDPLEFPPMPEPPAPSAFVAPSLASGWTLDVSSSGDVVYVAPGESVQLTVERTLPGGAIEDLTAGSTGTIYATLYPSSVLSVSADGLVAIHSSPSALRSLPFGFAIMIVNGSDVGWAQLAILDVDSDGDLMVDSWEAAHGLDPATVNPLDADTDGDHLSDLAEALLTTEPTIADSDGDGLQDGLEIAQGTNPWSDRSTRGRADRGYEFMANGQLAAARAGGAFRVANIAAADQFGANGPGSGPDFLSDDAVQVIGTVNRFGHTYYAFSEPFRIRQGATTAAGQLGFSDQPPPVPVSISATAPSYLIEVGDTVPLTVLAMLKDGSVANVTPTSAWTTYRVSSPAVLAVDGNGLVDANGVGTAFVTIVNGGATTVVRFIVTVAAITTDIVGFVEDEAGDPVPGVTVTLTYDGSTVATGLDGAFFFDDLVLPTELQSVVVRARSGDLGAKSDAVAVVSGGITDTGILVLQLLPGFNIRFVAGLTLDELAATNDAVLPPVVPDPSELTATTGGVIFTGDYLSIGVNQQGSLNYSGTGLRFAPSGDGVSFGSDCLWRGTIRDVWGARFTSAGTPYFAWGGSSSGPNDGNVTVTFFGVKQDAATDIAQSVVQHGPLQVTTTTVLQRDDRVIFIDVEFTNIGTSAIDALTFSRSSDFDVNNTTSNSFDVYTSPLAATLISAGNVGAQYFALASNAVFSVADGITFANADPNVFSNRDPDGSTNDYSASFTYSIPALLPGASIRFGE